MPLISWIDSARMRTKVTQVKQAKLIQFGTPEMAYYRDILIRAHPRLHEEALEILQRVATKGSRIIDMGSGQGACAARMRDHGYNVTAAVHLTSTISAILSAHLFFISRVQSSVETFVRQLLSFCGHTSPQHTRFGRDLNTVIFSFPDYDF